LALSDLPSAQGARAARFLTVGQQHDDAPRRPVVQDLRGQFHRFHKRRLPGRIERVHHAHDLLGRVRHRAEVERDIALQVGPGAVSDEPTLRNFVAAGNTCARALRTSSMRVTWLKRPWTVLPAMDPDASKTIIASSVQGVRVSSGACAAADPARSVINASAAGHVWCDSMLIP
jgi:hypothetical protein